MNSPSTINPQFEKQVTPLLSEFGYQGGIKELVQDQLTLMLQSKIDHYQAEIALYRQQSGDDYEQILNYAESATSEDFDLEDRLNDWRFAREMLSHYQAQMAQLADD
ncbi:hypothetical protein D5085_01050 [Ectothiorhodospiraceae bacterium BW-2]|nr:hypothetical protein D5085_01050 [Ectothiorhodospiraceae bacterium BW-2]